jgi:hypothetical protein
MTQMTILLVSYQILMLLMDAVLIVGSPETYITLNGQMAQLNLSGMAKGMLLVADCC